MSANLRDLLNLFAVNKMRRDTTLFTMHMSRTCDRLQLCLQQVIDTDGDRYYISDVPPCPPVLCIAIRFYFDPTLTSQEARNKGFDGICTGMLSLPSISFYKQLSPLPTAQEARFGLR